MLPTSQFYKNLLISHCRHRPTAARGDEVHCPGKTGRTGLQRRRYFQEKCFHEPGSLQLPILRKALKPFPGMSAPREQRLPLKGRLHWAFHSPFPQTTCKLTSAQNSFQNCLAGKVVLFFFNATMLLTMLQC